MNQEETNARIAKLERAVEHAHFALTFAQRCAKRVNDGLLSMTPNAGTCNLTKRAVHLLESLSEAVEFFERIEFELWIEAAPDRGAETLAALRREPYRRGEEGGGN